MLDSSTVISAERKRQKVVDCPADLLAALRPVRVSLSPVTVAELVHGIYRAQSPVVAQRRGAFIEELGRLVPVHPITEWTGWLVGEPLGQEEAKGNVLPTNDLLIAVAALERGYGVVTLNVRHFQMIPGLRVIAL